MPKPSGRNKVTLIIGRLDAESRSLAKKLDQLKFIYALYGLLDGLSTSYSTLAYFFSVFSADNTSSTDAMHDWMGSSSGAAIAATETITLVMFSLLANIFDDKDKNAFKKYVAVAWPYCRDSFKGLKNAYKGVRSSLQAIGMLSGNDLHNLIVPMGLAFGVISMLNRVCLRMLVKDKRIGKMKDNTKLLLKIQGMAFNFRPDLPQTPEERLEYKNSYILVGAQLYYIAHDGSVEEVRIDDRALFDGNIGKLNPDNESTFKLYLSDKDVASLITKNGGHVPPISGLDRQACKDFRGEIGRQSGRLNSFALLGAAYGGIVDGLYLYMGALGLTILSPPVFMAMAVCSAVFSLMCVTTRVYEEYDFQRKLQVTEARVEVALCCKELEALLGTLKRVSDPLKPLEDEELERLLTELRESSNPSIVADLDELQRLLDNFQALPPQAEAVQKAEAKSAFIEKLKVIYHAELSFKGTELKSKRKDVRSLTASSSVLAVFAGLKSGLAVYGAITSLMFAISTINAILLAPFPPAFLIAGVATGIACLLVFVIHALATNTPQLPDDTVEIECNRLFDLTERLKRPPVEADRILPQELEPPDVREAILESMRVPPPPQSSVSDWGEVVRSLGSGFSKGPRLLSFLQSIWQGIAGDDDTPIWLKIGVVCAVVQSLVFFFRALAKAFGRDAPDVIKQPSWVITSPPEPEVVGGDAAAGGDNPPESPRGDNPQDPPEFQFPRDGANSPLLTNSMLSASSTSSQFPPNSPPVSPRVVVPPASDVSSPRDGARSPLLSHSLLRAPVSLLPIPPIVTDQLGGPAFT